MEKLGENSFFFHFILFSSPVLCLQVKAKIWNANAKLLQENANFLPVNTKPLKKIDIFFHLQTVFGIYLFIYSFAIPLGVANDYKLHCLTFSFRRKQIPFPGQTETSSFLGKSMNLFKCKTFFKWKKYLVQPLKC